MATIEWQQRKETFNPEKNYFDIAHVTVSRETSKEEDRLSCKAGRFSSWGVSLGVICTLGILFGGGSLAALRLWPAFCIVFPTCVIGLTIALAVFLNKAQAYENALDQYHKDHDVWTTPEVEEIRKYNAEQQEIANKWRAEHPFEEQIRQCLLDPRSSVDIAKAAIIYVENYFNKEN